MLLQLIKSKHRINQSAESIQDVKQDKKVESFLDDPTNICSRPSNQNVAVKIDWLQCDIGRVSHAC